ncbi:MAG: hypothetical protein RIR11_5023 [Bacteroidota bacterium]|jgi:Leucine-rich repeat (LRR) protein
MIKNLKLQFFAANSSNGIDHLYSLNSNNTESLNLTGDHRLWKTIIEKIKNLFDSTKKEKNKDNGFRAVDFPDTIVQILLVQNKHLIDRNFLNQLAKVKLNVNEKDVKELHPREIHNPLETRESENKKFHPIITIGGKDFLSMYEESPNLDFETDEKPYWQDSRRGELEKYELQLDPRIKFLDSSIWHRYVPNNDVFEENFKHVLNKIITYSNLRLYCSLAALSTREFQYRMLENSVIAQYGDHGHHEAVTPFKFHSETMMEQKVHKFIKFFEAGRNKTSLMKLQWNMLLVDDYSEENISTIDKSAPKNKKEIIEQWLNDFNGEIIKFLNINASTNGKDKIISKGIQHLKDQTFDIILLDYLIGDSEIENSVGLKAYGHEFLLEIATSPERKKFKRGPFGRYWVFPISSFPFAFTDKLKQLNIDGSNERWYIAGGGDPICTPELFRLNFFRLLMRQISEVYLHEAALSRQLSRYDSITHLGSWCSAMIGRIEADVKNKELLMAERNNNSRFSETMEVFLDHQKKDDDFLDRLKNWLRTFSNYKKGTSAKGYYDDLDEIKHEFSQFGKLIDKIKTKTDKLIYDAEEKLIKKIGKSKEKIDFNQKHLYAFPIRLPEIYSNITSISLSGNRLKGLPASITRFPNLKKLDLSHNQELEYLPAEEIILHCKLLEELNLEGTKLGDAIKNSQPDRTSKIFPTQKLLEYIKDYNRKNRVSMPEKGSSEGIARIFISYSHIDIEWKDKLKAHLRSLELAGLATIWTDKEILPGEKWDNAILSNLNKSDIILFLISANFMASNYIQNTEIKNALTNKVSIIPIYLSPYSLEGTELADFQGLPLDGYKKPIISNHYSNPDEAFVKVVDGLRQIILRKKSPPHNHRQ